MGGAEEFVSYIEQEILKPLLEIEEAYQEVVEEWSSKLGVQKPRVVVTLQEVNECGTGVICEQDSECRLISGVYLPEHSTILLNYKSTIDVLLHLFVHHVQAQQIGTERFAQIRQSEYLRLPWSLRPTEIRALALSRKLYDTLCTQRVLKLWTDYVKQRIKKIEEEIMRARAAVAAFMRSALPSAQVRHYGYRMLSGGEI